MTKLLTMTAVAVAAISGCTATRADWGYSEPAPPPYCDPGQQNCPPLAYCAPGQYCQPYGYTVGTYGPPAAAYVPPEAYGRGDREENEEHGERSHEQRGEGERDRPREQAGVRGHHEGRDGDRD